MNKLIAALCCLTLAVSPLALAQGTGPGSKPAPMSKKEQAEKEKALHKQMAQCSTKAQGSKLKPGTPAFNRFISECLRG